MDLVHGEQIAFVESERCRSAPSVLAHIVGTVARPVATIQRRIEAGAYAAAPREEPVLHAVEAGQRPVLDLSLDHVSSENPAGAALLSSPMANTRNKVPIWSSSIKRSNAA